MTGWQSASLSHTYTHAPLLMAWCEGHGLWHTALIQIDPTWGSGTRPCTATWTASSGASRTSCAGSWAAARSSGTGTAAAPPRAPGRLAVSPRSPRVPEGTARLRCARGRALLTCADAGLSALHMRAQQTAADFIGAPGARPPPARPSDAKSREWVAAWAPQRQAWCSAPSRGWKVRLCF